MTAEEMRVRLEKSGSSFEGLIAMANSLGFPDVVIRRRGERFEVWLDAVERAHRGEAGSPLGALEAAVREAVEESLKGGAAEGP